MFPDSERFRRRTQSGITTLLLAVMLLYIFIYIYFFLRRWFCGSRTVTAEWPPHKAQHLRMRAKRRSGHRCPCARVRFRSHQAVRMTTSWMIDHAQQVRPIRKVWTPPCCTSICPYDQRNHRKWLGTRRVMHGRPVLIGSRFDSGSVGASWYIKVREVREVFMHVEVGGPGTRADKRCRTRRRWRSKEEEFRRRV